MDVTQKARNASNWLQAMERGEATPAAALAGLLALGADKMDAEEMIFIAQGGSDTVVLEEIP